MSGVCPSRERALTSAPATSKRSTTARLPFKLASSSGVTLKRFAASAAAPDSSSKLDHRGIVELRGPMQRRGAVAFGRVDVGAAIEQRVHGHAVLALDGVDEGSRFGRER